MPNWLKGELIGTFLLVFFGGSAVAVSVALGGSVGVFQVAIVWGLGLAVAIYLTADLGGAHLNPAITLAMVLFRKFPIKRLPGYFVAQFTGAFLAAACVFLLFEPNIQRFEKEQGIQRGQPGSEASAMIFGEFYPNPGGQALDDSRRQTLSSGRAFFGEFLGTALLALAVFGFTAKRNASSPGALTPLALGLTLAVLICVFGPLTMAGFNPARDFGPRVFSALAGWGALPFAVNGTGWFTVYIVAPMLGALGGAGVARLLYPESA